jgi:ABC-type lipoprotein export system ATPase subunit
VESHASPHRALDRLSKTMTSSHLTIALQGVTKAFSLGDGKELEVLNIPALELMAASYTVLKGPSGSGKTTLLNLMAGITTPSSGQICLDETDIFALTEARRDRFRAEHIGYVFQTFNLLASLTALENVLLAMLFTPKLPRRHQRQRATAMLAKLGLSGRLSHRPHQLSRGEQQRVAIARALVNDPSVVLADEPCASLDPNTARVVLAEFLAICREERKTVLVVSHEESALQGADRVLDMTAINRAVGALL